MRQLSVLVTFYIIANYHGNIILKPYGSQTCPIKTTQKMSDLMCYYPFKMKEDKSLTLLSWKKMLMGF